jgi:hypothetical protein
MFQMLFRAVIYPDGTVHVQNSVMGHLGQHHVHTLKGYKQWKKDTERECEETKAKKGEKCDCGLKVGQTREYDGQTWDNEEHLEWK